MAPVAIAAVVSATFAFSSTQPISAAAAHPVPPAPAKVTAFSGNGSATVQWSVPTRRGGVPIIAYVITPYRGNKADRPRVVRATSRTETVTGLKNGVSFRFRVAAENQVGSGPQSRGSNMITVGTPAVPTGVRASMTAPGTLSVVFTTPASNGAVITGYAVTCASPDGGATTTASGVASPIVVAGLTSGRTHTCTVAAINRYGKGLPSAPSVTTLAPLSAVVATPDVGYVTVSWTQLPVTGVTYVVTSSPVGRSCRAVDAASCTVPVSDATPWQFSVIASDASGTSPPSSLTSVLPHRWLLVIAGQSNAVGTESYASDPTTFNDYLAAPYANGADAASTISWIPSSRGGLLAAPGDALVPVDTPQMLDVPTPVQVFGPELGLARKLWADTRQPVSIVKAAIGSTSLAVDWNPETPGGYYAQMVARVLAAMTADAAAGRLDTIGAFYWYQGEDDAANAAWYAAYRSNLEQFIARLRRDLPMSASAPIALAKESLATRIAYRQASADCPPDDCAAIHAGDDAIRAADDWAAANLPHVVTVDTLGLARTPPLIHLSNLGELALGSELAVATEHHLP